MAPLMPPPPNLTAQPANLHGHTHLFELIVLYCLILQGKTPPPEEPPLHPWGPSRLLPPAHPGQGQAAPVPSTLGGRQRLEGRGLRQGLEVLVQARQQVRVLLALLLLLRLEREGRDVRRGERESTEVSAH